MKLTAKVFVAQLVAVTIALTMTAWLIDWRAGLAYRGYFTQTQAAQLAALAEQAALQYTESGDWQAVQAWIDQFSFGMMAHSGMHRGMGQGMGGMMQGGVTQGRMAGEDAVPAYLLVDSQSGKPLTTVDLPDDGFVDAAVLAAGAPVVVNGVTVASIVAVRASEQFGLAEQTLLAQVQSAILLSAAIAGVFALAIGALLVTSILRPLRVVERTVMAVANGNLAARVALQGEDEIANLGVAVNHMAETLQAQEALRQRLASDVAHELRTPLSVIQGNLQAILDGVYPLNNEEIQTVLSETQLLSRLVADLHELAQAEAGQLPLHRQRLSVGSVLNHMFELYAPLAAQQGIQLDLEQPPSPLHVNADPDRLQQILHNLLGNALRHTPGGATIRLRAGLERAAALVAAEPVLRDPGLQDNAVRFTIEDTGSGIHQADLPYVFDRFYRATASRPVQAGPAAGAGLGLAIAKALVQAHGGQIGVYATTPQGATFWFTLPANGLADPAISSQG